MFYVTNIRGNVCVLNKNDSLVFSLIVKLLLSLNETLNADV